MVFNESFIVSSRLVFERDVLDHTARRRRHVVKAAAANAAEEATDGAGGRVRNR